MRKKVNFWLENANIFVDMKKELWYKNKWLEYYKTISKVFINEGKETYGIGIVKKCRNNGKEKFESREINNILVEEKQTEKLLKILVDNKVTPIALDDVLTDLIKVP